MLMHQLSQKRHKQQLETYAREFMKLVKVLGVKDDLQILSGEITEFRRGWASVQYQRMFAKPMLHQAFVLVCGKMEYCMVSKFVSRCAELVSLIQPNTKFTSYGEWKTHFV
jgi:hypothetical protein